MSRKRKSPPKSPAPQAYAGELRPSAAVSPPYRPLPVRLPPPDPRLCRAIAQAQKEIRKYAKEESRGHHKQSLLRSGDRRKRIRYALSGASVSVSRVQQPQLRGGIRGRHQMRVARLLSLLLSPDVSALRARICSARKTRRRALFSLRRAGKGTSGHRTPRWSASSSVRCS